MTIDRLEELEEIAQQIKHNYEQGYDIGFNLNGNDHYKLAYYLNSFIDAEIERLSVTDEEIETAIRTFEAFCEHRHSTDWVDYTISNEWLYSSAGFAIEALKAYRPVRENRTTEPVEKTDTLEPCDWCEKEIIAETCVWDEDDEIESVPVIYCPSCGRKL